MNDDFFKQYPYPIVSLLKRALQSQESIAKFIQLTNLLEVVLRYLSTISVALKCMQRYEDDTTSRLIGTMQKPSLGHFCQILQTIPKRLQKKSLLQIGELESLFKKNQNVQNIREAYRAIQYFLGKKKESVPGTISIMEFFDLLVALRNKTKGHGAIQANFTDTLTPLIEQATIEMLQNLVFLALYPLLVKENGSSQPLLGSETNFQDEEERKIFVGNKEKMEPWLLLSPMMIWKYRHFWFLNGWEKDAEYLCYETGDLIHVTNMDAIAQYFENYDVEAVPAAKLSEIKMEVASTPVYEVKTDLSLMAQDINRVVGPSPKISLDVDVAQEIKKVIHTLEFEFEPNKLGEVIVSTRSWCRSRYLMEAIIYHFEAKQICTENIVESTLNDCLSRIGELGVSKVALNPLGTEYGIVSMERFVEIFKQAFIRNSHSLRNLQSLIFVVREPKQSAAMEAALAKLKS